jgi:Spy/CpxP family protein refolding chaperone
MKDLIKVLAITAAAVLTTYGQAKAPEARPVAEEQRAPLRQRFDRTPLELTPEQKTKMEEINRAYSTNATPLFGRLSTARRELEGLINQATLNEAGIRAKAKEIGDLEAELAIARAKRYTAFLAFLTPEQAKRINSGAPIARPFQPTLHEGQTPPPVAPNK